MNNQERIVWISTGERSKRRFAWADGCLMVGIISLLSVFGFVLLAIEALS